ncbi:hypothetical protein CLO_1713 [Clostridium botulinum E1 str. 'BoNT E Beluga']|nr:hypothetical protein CLO_1713 [Clostridium botulinum E1 str. 'BoNT E Beluga']
MIMISKEKYELLEVKWLSIIRKYTIKTENKYLFSTKYS